LAYHKISSSLLIIFHKRHTKSHGIGKGRRQCHIVDRIQRKSERSNEIVVKETTFEAIHSIYIVSNSA